MSKTTILAAIPILILLLMASVTLASPNPGTKVKLYSDDFYVVGAGATAANPKSITAGSSASVTVELNARNGNIPSDGYNSDNTRFDLGNYSLSKPASPPNATIARSLHQYLYFAARNYNTHPTLDTITVTITVASNVPAGDYRFRPIIDHGSSISLEPTRVTSNGQSADIPFTTPYIYIRVTNTSIRTSTSARTQDLSPQSSNPAAPAIAASILKQYKIKNNYRGGNYIADIAKKMGPGTTFNNVSKENTTAYYNAVYNYLRNTLNAHLPYLP
jgi:hypothetical protein